MNTMVSEEQRKAFERLRQQFPPTVQTMPDAQADQTDAGGEGVTFERFREDVALLKADVRQSGLRRLLWGMVLLIAFSMVFGFILNKVFFGFALFVLLGGCSMFFSRKQRNFEICEQIDRELLGRG